MWVVLRILFGVLMFLAFKEARMNAQSNPMYGDLSNAFWVAVVLILGMANGIVWTPFFASKISDPLTGGTIDSEFKDDKSLLMRVARWCDSRGYRLVARWVCFVEAARRPWLPAPYVVGLANSEMGSWLEKVYATEVFKFNNAQNCLIAYETLKRHGIDPRPHANPGVNLVLVSQERELKPTPETIEAPTAPPAPAIQRDKRIKLGM
jgi:hypothetical protein